MITDEQRGYSRGYAAGRRRQEQDRQREIVAGLQEDFVQRMMVSISPQMISSPWGRNVNGEWKPDKSAQQIMATVRMVAEEAAKACDFYATAQGMSAGTAKTAQPVEGEARQPGSQSECAQREGQSPHLTHCNPENSHDSQ